MAAMKAFVLLMLLLVIILLFSGFQTCNAKRTHGKNSHHHHHKNNHHHHGKKPSPAPAPTPASGPFPKPQPNPSSPPASDKDIFNVLHFGAEGDGKSDDTKAFLTTWAKACKVKASTVLVPSKSTFLVGPISFNGRSCQPNIVFQLDGTIMAPTSQESWGSDLLQWIEFIKLKDIAIQGTGTIEGQGAFWWGKSTQLLSEPIRSELSNGMPHKKPTALRFYRSSGVTVTGITMRNSPKCHLKFDNCDGVDVHGIRISAPGDSPNTDGIHLQNSQNVVLHHNQLSCGDDCVSIQTGCRNIYIHHVNCGPGHGISIGGLGNDNTKACVSNVTVENVVLRGTMTGVRIKTWQGGSGSVENVKFSNIDVTEVKVPIMINQFYCDKKSCKNQTKGVAVSGISYENIKGTFTREPVHLACSESIPCLGISLSDIDLQPFKGAKNISPFCSHSYGQSHSPINPPIDCLQIGNPPKNKAMSGLGSC